MNFDHIKKCKAVLVSNDKGQKGMYVDGTLVLQGEKLSILDILRALDITHSTVFYSSKQMEKMDDKFPDGISDLYEKDKEGVDG